MPYPPMTPYPEDWSDAEKIVYLEKLVSRRNRQLGAAHAGWAKAAAKAERLEDEIVGLLVMEQDRRDYAEGAL